MRVWPLDFECDRSPGGNWADESHDGTWVSTGTLGGWVGHRLQGKGVELGDQEEAGILQDLGEVARKRKAVGFWIPSESRAMD